jgi:hypothetical protein
MLAQVTHSALYERAIAACFDKGITIEIRTGLLSFD